MVIDKDIYLSHYGKKGMRWGVRKSSGRTTRVDVLKARKELPSATQRYTQARIDYYSNQTTKGKNAAKQILKQEKRSYSEIKRTSKRAADGQEVAQKIFQTAGSVLSVVLTAASVAAFYKKYRA